MEPLIDVNLIESTLQKLTELGAMLKDDQTAHKYSNAYILEMIDNADRNLKVLNTVNKDFVNAHKKEPKAWEHSTADALKGYFDEMDKVSKNFQTLKEITSDLSDPKKVDKEFEQLNSREKYDGHKAAKYASTFIANAYALDQILANNMHLKLSRKRKFAQRMIRIYFKIKNLSSSILTIFVCTLIGFLFEALMGDLFPNTASLAIVFFVALIGAFIINKPIEHNSQLFFWKQARTHTSQTLIQLNILTKQILLIQEFQLRHAKNSLVLADTEESK
ncbi:hypothetical protein [Pedobacter sp. Hv1]|uniref:hypothetical protein n=1 Tax=Pedobacter sp. Hv1 TaxID=1740090 RepID=UPI0006D89ACD|nr:hypothetical protein [Pedobacter sp. Hv1]KQC01352.1 hypothetical protein AQF98_06470 [Pedobacter sp. Hv1]